MSNYYAGRARNGGHTFHIEGVSYTWDGSKYMNNKCKFAAVGQTFEAEYTIEDNDKGGQTLSFDWSTFDWNIEVVEVDDKYIIINAAAEKERTMKTNHNKIKDEALENMTLKEIRHGAWNNLNHSQKQCLIARIMGYLGV